MAKIITDEPGVYELGYSMLAELQMEDVINRPAAYQLINIGRAQHFWLVGNGRDARLRFYAQSYSSKYTDKNVYWLVPRGLEPGLGFDDTTLEIDNEPALRWSNLEGSFIARLHVEENHLYLPQSDNDDHWYWLTLPAPQVFAQDVELESVAEGQGEIRLSIWGGTESPNTPDHHLRVAVNDTVVIDQEWDGKGTRVITGTLPLGLLKNGTNQILLNSPGDSGALADVIHLDWFELDYPHDPAAENDQLVFIGSGVDIALSGFSELPWILDITDPDQPIDVSARLTPEMIFGSEREHKYLAYGSRGIKPATDVQLVSHSPNLLSTEWDVDYIVVGPADLTAPMQPLISLREAQGLSTMVINIETIYNQFNSGLAEPDAIKRFVQYASESWQRMPKYLLLVGDSSHDPKGYISSPEANRIPPYLVDTVFGGETSSDINFVQVNDDPWPDIAVGHIPARTPGQVQILVEKIVAYERAIQEDDGPRQILAIVDGQELSFQADAQLFADQFSQPAYSVEIFSPAAGEIGASSTIHQYLSGNKWLVAYFGHGSINMWGKDRLFTEDDVNKLNNADNLPIILNFTCLTGLYTHPTVQSLAESFLWNPKGGAVAVLAPSSLTLPTDQNFLSTSLAQLLVDNPDMTIGEVHLLARRQVPVNTPGTLDVLQTFMLFGDPATRLRGGLP